MKLSYYALANDLERFVNIGADQIAERNDGTHVSLMATLRQSAIAFRSAALAQQAQPEPCLDHGLRIQRLVEANTLLKQTQPEMPTREMMEAKAFPLDYSDGATCEEERDGPLVILLSDVLALFAPKEPTTKCVCWCHETQEPITRIL